MRASKISLTPFIAVALLAFVGKTAKGFFFPPIIPIFWSNCRLGWFIIPFVLCSQNGGQTTPAAPPLICDADEYVWKGKCEPRASYCPDAPNTVIVSSPSTPCRCESPGYVPPAGSGQQACQNDPQGFGYCETTGANGSGSICKVKCNPGYTARGTQCFKDVLRVADCNPSETIGIGVKGQGCICVLKTSTSATAQPCPQMFPAGNPRGDMTCKLDPATNGEICIPECDPGQGLTPFGRSCQ